MINIFQRKGAKTQGGKERSFSARVKTVRFAEIVCRGWQAVSGVTPETTRGTRVLQHFSEMI